MPSVIVMHTVGDDQVGPALQLALQLAQGGAEDGMQQVGTPPLDLAADLTSICTS